jgi:hypothetical protein
MSDTTIKRNSISQLFKQQVAINFIVVAILLVIAGFLVFKVQGEDYTQLTAVGFIASVFFSFVMFLPASTLFACRAELAQGKVVVQDEEKTGAKEPIARPYATTVPLGFAAALLCTGIVCAIVYGTGWTPSPAATTLISMLFVVPYAVIVKRYIFRDIEGLAAIGPMKGKRVASKAGHIWMSYILPNLALQAIINMPLAVRGFSHVAALIADRAGPGMVPVAALVPDFAITFVFVCGFTFLNVIAHTAADMYEGEFSYSGRARGINGFVFFVLILLMGVGLGALVAAVAQALGIVILSFAAALVLKALVVLLSVYVAARLGVGWMGKKFNDAVARKTDAMAHAD